MDIEIVKKELLIAIRGKRSQTYISQKLGYDYNQVYRWESGRIDIAWTEFIKLCKVSRRDISGVLKRVFNFQDNPADYSRFLNHLIGNLKQKEIGTVIDCTPYRLRKWLRGQTSPTVVDFLTLFHRFKHQLVDFVSAIGVIENVPSLGKEAHLKARQLALHHELPYVGALLHALELPEYSRSKVHSPGWLAHQIGISQEEEEMALRQLELAGLVQRRNGLFETKPVFLDISGDFESFKSTRRYWLKRAEEHVEAMTHPSRKDFFGYLVFSCSEDARAKVIDKYYQFLTEVRHIVEVDSNPELIQVLNVQLFDPKVVNPLSKKTLGKS